MRSIKKLIYIIIVLGFIQAANAATTRLENHLRYEQIDQSRGFVQNSIFRIYQDHYGYIYCGTPNGLFKYDGYEFERFANLSGNENSLMYSFVRDITQNQRESIWLLNNKALNRYDIEQRSFHRYTFPKLGSLMLHQIAADKCDDSRIWISTSHNVGVLNTDDSLNLTHPIVKKPAQGTRVRYIEPCNNGGIWVALANNSLHHITMSEDGVIKQSKPLNINTTSIIESEDGGIYTSTPNSILKIELNAEGKPTIESKIFQMNDKDISIEKLLLANSGEMWAIVWGYGVVKIKLDSSEEPLYYPIFRDNDIFNSASFGDALIDEGDTMWIGTYNGGLFKIDLNQSRFFSLKNIANCATPSFRYFANSITGDNRGNIWIGTHGRGVMRVRIENERVVHYNNQNIGYDIPQRSNIYAINYYRNKLWLIENGHVVRLTTAPNGDVADRSIIDSDQHNISNFSYLYGDEHGVLWIGDFTAGGVYFIDTNSSKLRVQRLKFDNRYRSTLFDSKISTLFRDSDGMLWFGTVNDGIYRGAVNGDRIQDVERINFGGEMKGIDINSCFKIYEHSDRTIWIALFGAGVVRANLDSLDDLNSMIHYTSKSGLPDDAIYSITPDDAGMLWFSSDNGISRLNPDSGSFKNYGSSDGIENFNFRKWSQWSGSNGYIYFGGTNGVTMFHPNQVVDNNYSPRVQITNLKIAEEDSLFEPYLQYTDTMESGEEGSEMILKPDQNSLMFSFASLQFSNTEQVEYFYMLEGIDKDWIATTSKYRFASYSHLPHGHYTFRVKSLTRDKVWSRGETLINIEILPHWYQTVWARGLFLLLALIMLYIWNAVARHRRRLNASIADQNKQIEMNHAKLEFYTNISHEIKTPLTVMSGVVESCINGKNKRVDGQELYVVHHNIRRLLQLVTQLLDFRRAVSNHLPFNPIHGDIVQFIYDLIEPFDHYSSQRGIEFSFDSSTRKLMMDFDPDKIDKILSNLLSNAFKYNKERGSVAIKLEHSSQNPSKYAEGMEGEYITICVTDSGIGICEEDIENIFNRFFQSTNHLKLTDTNKGVGVGLSYTKILVELHGGSIHAESKLGEGSRFYVILPTSQPNVEEGNADMILADVATESRQNIVLDSPYSEMPSKSQIQHAQINSHQILVVEDNVEIRNFVREYLSSSYSIIEAENGKVGLEMSIEHIPDLIISDVMMPEMDGIEMVTHIKSNPLTNHIPIIMLTVNDHIDNRIDGIRAGADSYITKPFNVEHLRIRVEKLLELRTTLKDKYIKLSGDKLLSDIDINSDDKEFLSQLESIIEQNLSNPELSVAELEKILDYSHMQLYRKIKSITSLSAIEFIRNYRLKRSVDMMHSTNKQIREILYDVGFSSPSYYSKCFKERYGITPKEFLQKIR